MNFFALMTGAHTYPWYIDSRIAADIMAACCAGELFAWRAAYQAQVELVRADGTRKLWARGRHRPHLERAFSALSLSWQKAQNRLATNMLSPN